MSTKIITIYKVTLPSWVVWPGKVTVNISYTELAAREFIKIYPNKFLAAWMTVEEEEIIAYEEKNG